ncbi:MAG: hypothetical protein ACXW2G_03240 [Burkholderiaceae bacterium]
MNRMHWLKTSATLVAATVLLAACGGGSDDGPGAPPPAGDGLTQTQREDGAASASVAGLFAFATALVNGMTGDASEPRAIDGISPPLAEDAEPTAIAL